jgi:uncharacterized protein (DUF362 family)
LEPEEFLRGINRRTFFQIISFTGVAGLIYPRKLISSLLPSASSRVVIVEDNTATNGTFINENTVQVMTDNGIKALAQQNDIGEAWKTLLPNIHSSSNIAIKVNCMNPFMPTHPEVTNAVVNGIRLMDFGATLFPENNIIIYDRTNNDLQVKGGYTVNTSGSGVRCFGIDTAGVGLSDQTYDVGGCPQQLSNIITEMVDYIINISVLKSHSPVAGVSLCLKNHYGSRNQWNSMLHNNYGSPCIPALNAVAPILTKQKVNICDALFGIKSGNPDNAGPQFISNKIIMSQDIVATDYWGRELLKENGWIDSGQSRHIETAVTDYNLGTNDPLQMDVVNITNPSVPVELALFEVTVVDRNVVLNWETETESNNFGFEIERAFDSDWKTIGFVKGKGTTNRPSYYEFVDTETAFSNVRYRLKQIDTNGSFTYSQIRIVQLNHPLSYQLEQNYPNPFNNQTVIRFNLPKPAEIKLTIFDYNGQTVRRLVYKTLSAGGHQVLWDGLNDYCKPVASGVYVCRLTSGSFNKAIIMQLVK